MIKSITVTTPKDESLKMVLEEPSTAGLAITNVEGLGPANATINTSSTPYGSLYTSSHQETRNIVFTLLMWPYEDIELMRQRTYKYFPLKKKITITVETDQKVVSCTGYVESNNPVIFSEQEYTQISILCPDPYFYDTEESEMNFNDFEPGFYFPFCNDSLDEKLLFFGTIYLNARRQVNYNGDEDTGFVATFLIGGEDVKNIRFVNVDTKEQFTIQTDKITSIAGGALTEGDQIIWSTIKGEKSLQLYRNGHYTNILASIDPESDWMQLSNGTNTFEYHADSGESHLQMTMTYRNAYTGV